VPQSMTDTPRVPDKRVTRYLQFYTWRLNRMSEDDIARDLHFDSPPSLYETLSGDGFPVCPKCGETPAGPGHCKTPRKSRPSDGEVMKLPPAREAIPLFKSVIGSPFNQDPDRGWNTGLYYLCARLMNLEEELHGKRFVWNTVYRPESELPSDHIFRREDFSDDDWIEVCERFSQNHWSTDEFSYYDTAEAPSMSAGGFPSRARGEGYPSSLAYTSSRVDL
jgi:hypothetical protein